MINVPHLLQCQAVGRSLFQLNTEIFWPPEDAWKKRCGMAEPAARNPQNVWDKLRAPISIVASHMGHVLVMGEFMNGCRIQSMRIVSQSVTSALGNPLSGMT